MRKAVLIELEKIVIEYTENCFKLKTDQPYPRDYPHKPSDYRHTNRRARTNIHTNIQANGCYKVHYLPALRSIIARYTTRNVEYPNSGDKPIGLSPCII